MVSYVFSQPQSEREKVWKLKVHIQDFLTLWNVQSLVNKQLQKGGLKTSNFKPWNRSQLVPNNDLNVEHEFFFPTISHLPQTPMDPNTFGV